MSHPKRVTTPGEAREALHQLILPREDAQQFIDTLRHFIDEASAPLPMRLRCPQCGELHIDEGEFATRAHHTHACQECGEVWRPAIVCTVGVEFLPGFKNGAKP